MAELIAIDGNSLLFRAYYALTDMQTAAGEPTGGLHGFLTMLLKLAETAPEYMVVAFDVHEPTFRHKEYTEYKAGRAPTPPDLLWQFPMLKQILTEMGIAVIECPGFEADDIIGTYVRMAEKVGKTSLIVTGDRDALQLITEKTHVLLTKRGLTDTVEHTEETLMEQYGLTPDRMRDLKGLMGDGSDNIPGIPGVGEKTALKLLTEYGTIFNVLAHGDEIKGKLGERVRDNRASAEMSYRIGTICTEAPVNRALADCAFNVNGLRGAAETLRRLELRAVLNKLPGDDAPKAAGTAVSEPALIPVKNAEDLKAVMQAHAGAKRVAVLDDAVFSFAFDAEKSFFISAGETLFDDVMDPAEALRALAPFLEDGATEKILFDAKDFFHRAAANGINVNGTVFDCRIADYLINALRPAETSTLLCERFCGLTSATAALLFPTMERLAAMLNEQGMTSLYEDMELSLMRLLYRMETDGVRVDAAVLHDLEKRFDARAAELEEEIFSLAGERFNILSPKQLGTVLFEKLGLPPLKKTKSGYSTDADTLDKLADRHPIVGMVQEYRFTTKLKSTFIVGLLNAMSPTDGRVRTAFQQCVTATGRLSSAEPNLQNIPVRSELGREIRKAFIPDDGCVLVGADYSQIELRVLAHLSGDPRMTEAFRSGEDIHRQTASEVFGVTREEVTPAMRSAAKAVNFGIVYGISDFGLARNIDIGVKEAAGYIKKYYERYPGIKAYMDDAVERGKTKGYAETMYGRRRGLPELKSGNFNMRSFGERVAMNMPVQGTAADLIKLAMIDCDRTLREKGLHAKMLLQVHDELIFSVPEPEAEAVSDAVKECMERVAKLNVPLIAEVKTGKSWFETK